MDENTNKAQRKDLEIEHFKSLFDLAKHYNDKLTEAFTFFIQTITIVVGACFWLVIEKKIDKTLAAKFELLSDAIVTLLTVVTICRIFGNLTAWYNIRMQQHDSFDGVRPPRPFRSSVMECFMATGVVAAWLTFLLANPFSLIPSN